MSYNMICGKLRNLRNHDPFCLIIEINDIHLKKKKLLRHVVAYKLNQKS